MFIYIGDRRKGLLILAATAVVMIIGTYLVYSQIKFCLSTQEEINAIDIETGLVNKIAKDLGMEEGKLQRARQELESIEHTIFTAIEPGEIPVHLAGDAERRGLSVVTAEPSKAVSEQYYIALPVSMTIRGAHNRALEFLSDLEGGGTLGGLVEVKSLSLKRGPDSGEVTMDFTLVVYLRN